MTRFAAVALCLIGIAFPVWAQRGGSHGGARGGGGFGAASHGGFSGGMGHAGGGGFRPSAPPRLAMPSRYVGGGRRGFPPAGSVRTGGGYGMHGGANRGDRGDRDHRGRYRRPYNRGYGYGIVPWASGVVAPWGWDGAGYGDDSGYDDAQAYPNYGDQNGDQSYNSPLAEPSADQGPPPPSYQPQPQGSQSTPAQSHVVEDAQGVTLVFRDGRPSEQIHNYILSRTTLSVLDQHRRDIPVSELDLAATQKANRDAGVDFHLPNAPG